MPNLVLGVSGSVAAYRAADLARELMRAGFTVRVCLTDAAEQFVTKALFEALTGQPCLESVFDEPVAGRMAHIDWARQADIVLIAPATANTINRIAYGLADDMLSTLALAYEGPMLIAPAMNPSMYANSDTQEAMERLCGKGVLIVEPAEGDVACGENGQGKLASIPSIVAAVQEVGAVSKLLEGKKVLITSGPTRERIDDVRFLSNRSSGKMGAALARAAMLMGAEVTVVSGPSAAALPIRADVVRVESAEQMLTAAQRFAVDADLIVGAAAVADYRPADPVSGKVRRSADPIDLRLVPNPDVIATLAEIAKPNCKVVGFAAEPSGDTSVALEKIKKKGLFAIAHNDVSDSAIGFESDQNALTLMFEDGRSEASGKRSKLACALWLLERVAN
jgi:phosphopantothenoylcysteine decarboxylase/phosphopantothenate--cysteine ligase